MYLAEKDGAVKNIYLEFFKGKELIDQACMKREPKKGEDLPKKEEKEK